MTSGTTQGGGPLSLDTFPNTQFTASDAEFAAPGFRTVNPGEAFGLADVSYAVSSTTPDRDGHDPFRRSHHIAVG